MVHPPPAQKTGFSWLGFFFAPSYFAGYGKPIKAAVLALLCGIPGLGVLVVGIYGGITAPKDLPIQQQPFQWAGACSIFFLQFAIALIFLYVPLDFQRHFAVDQQRFLQTEVAGLWSDSTGQKFEINLLANRPYLKVNGEPTPFTILKIDEENRSIDLAVRKEQKSVVWTLRQIYFQGESSRLTITFENGRTEVLSFVRNLL